MKKFIAIISAVVICISSAAFHVAAYEFDDSSILVIDGFDQQDESLEKWFMWLPMDVYGKRTYYDMLDDNFAYTLHELLIPFDTGRIEGNERTALLNQYGFSELYNIYRLDEMQQTFNAVYNTNIDIASLDGLKMDGSHELVKIIDGYVFVQLSPHGTMTNPNPSGGNRLGANSEYWRWYYADDWNPSDTIYTIVSYKNVAGYDIRTIDYIGYEPPSDEILDSYNGAPALEINNTEISGVQQFRRVVPYNGVVYTAEFLANDGNITFKAGNTTTIHVPYTPREGRQVCSFAIHGDRIYFVSGFNGSEYSNAEICSCNIDGRDYQILASDASNYSTCFINNGYIYYDKAKEYGISGIGKVTLDGDITDQIVTRENSHLSLCEADTIYYNADGRNYTCDINGNNETQVAEYYDKCAGFNWNSPSVISPNTGMYYHYTKGTLWETNAMSRESKALFSTAGDIRPVAVTDEALYYVRLVPNNDSGKYAYIFRYAFDGNSDISVIMNDSPITFDQLPIIYNDRTLVPLRAIFEALGATVTWDGETQTVTAEKDGTTIKLTIGEYKFYKNGSAIPLDVPGMIVNDRTLVPVRAVSEAFDCMVDWDGGAQTVYIHYDESKR